ncbi:hypothetical protein SteCoe_31434 [Stentor coeruleus]|uniref:Uncharacterized protein n=1 Tax=Stentor coeruleus TaxID=5963 RepID=A0A1R2B1E1_9CILI|nr:hypothetical protein SteCoe_31434 [Stentor coeruleus]
MSKFLSLLTLFTFVVLSFGNLYPKIQTHNNELPQNSKSSLLESLVQKSLELQGNLNRGNFLFLIQSEGEDLYDEISTVTNLPEEEDEGEVASEDDDILATAEISDPSLSLEEEMVESVQNEGALIYG